MYSDTYIVQHSGFYEQVFGNKLKGRAQAHNVLTEPEHTKQVEDMPLFDASPARDKGCDVHVRCPTLECKALRDHVARKLSGAVEKWCG